MRLAPAGKREWGGGGLLLVLLVAACWLVIPVDWANWLVTAVAVVMWLSMAWFFRDPNRPIPAGTHAGDLLSPADGRISAIERCDHHEAIDGPAMVIRIFLSVLNVHVNRVPCDLEVRGTVYKPGKYLDARTAESARVNESMLVQASRFDGLAMGIRQVSGAIARRIVCPVEPGQQFAQGERYGMIKFGSTTELILPEDCGAVVRVDVGTCVRGGRTVLAHVPPQD